MEKMTRDERAMLATPLKPVIRTNTLSIIGFCLLLAGPALLAFAVWRRGIETLSQATMDTLAVVAFALPIAGTTAAHTALDRWKGTGWFGRILSIITVVLCNPFFFIIYMLFCIAITGRWDASWTNHKGSH